MARQVMSVHAGILSCVAGGARAGAPVDATRDSPFHNAPSPVTMSSNCDAEDAEAGRQTSALAHRPAVASLATPQDAQLRAGRVRVFEF